jgi:hypothetical protein
LVCFNWPVDAGTLRRRRGKAQLQTGCSRVRTSRSARSPECQLAGLGSMYTPPPCCAFVCGTFESKIVAVRRGYNQRIIQKHRILTEEKILNGQEGPLAFLINNA